MVVRLLSSCVDLNVSKIPPFNMVVRFLLLLLLFELIYYHLLWTTFFMDLNISKDITLQHGCNVLNVSKDIIFQYS